MHDRGHSLRQIARAAGLTPQGVKHVLSRDPRAATQDIDPERQVQRWALRTQHLAVERAQLLLALNATLSERELAELSGLSRTAVRHQLARARAGEEPQIVRARG
jgi:lambda repressor-like predicted transcriptional regulator